MTINPQYTYTDNDGIEKTVPLSQKTNIPKQYQIKYSKLNFCSQRFKAIRTQQNNENGIVVRVRNCDMNKKITDTVDGIKVPIASTETKNLSEEPGIPELELLYYDDYDFDKGKYIGMTEDSQKTYNNDLLKFYTAFTGEKKIPFKKDDTGNILKDKNGNPIPLITKFSDIELKDFHNQELCINKDSPWHKSYKGKPSDKLFKQYADHLKESIQKSQEKEKSLLTIINKIFSYWLDPKKDEKILTINPELTEKSLQELIEKTREIIVTLYIGCEEDFQKGLAIFEAIVKAKMLETSKKRIENFEQKVDELQDTEKKAL